MRKLIVLMIVLAALLTLAFPAAAQDVVPRFEPSNCSFTPPGNAHPECGYLVVPEDRGDPNSDTIRLAVAVFKSDSPNPKPDPVIYFEGGPGGSTLEQIQFSFGSILAPYLVDRDVIAFDQRGVGLSQPALDCQELIDLTYATLDQRQSIEEEIQAYTGAVEACGARLTREGVNLQAYNTAESAADVNDLRQVLGYEQLNLFGISYGTRLALTVMRDFPQAVRSVIIDSVVPLQGSGFDPGQTADRALTELFNACAGDEACNSLYPDLETVFYDLADSLNASPVSLNVPDMRTGNSLEVLVDGNDFVGLVFQAMYVDSLIEQLPEVIYAARDGDLSFFSNILLLQLFQLTAISNGMYFAVNCNEEYPFDTAESIQAKLDTLPEGLQGFARESMIDPSTLGLCQALGTRTPDPIENQPVVSDIPTLVVSGQFDPITPPDNGREVAATLSRSFFYEFPGLTHGVIPAGSCPTSIALQFFDNPTTAPDTSCIASMPALQFVLTGDIGSAEPIEVKLVPFTDKTFGFSGVKPEGWRDVTLGTVMRGEGSSDQTSLIQLAAPFVSPEQLLGVLGQQYGWQETPPSSGTRAANGLTWTLYQFDVLGFPAALATAEGNGNTYFVQMTFNRGEREGLYEAVFLPVVDAFTPDV
jgi:pimeloyl-ACP methyl ester carboxylesterase